MFAYDLSLNNRLNTIEPRHTKKGIISSRIPSNANEILAEGEFNRFYIRALCRRVIAEKINELEVFRAKQVSSPRLESESKIGMKIDPNKLLKDLRENIGIDTVLGLPAGPNSGLSVKIWFFSKCCRPM